MLEIHVIANGDVFREAFNAMVTLLGESTFKTAFRLSVLFAVLGIVITYIKGRDLTVFARWFTLYFVVTVLLLGPKTTLVIFDSSNPGATYTIDHVPYGLAFPASFITSVAYGLEKGVEEAFHMPDDATYSKTGMLFGSRIFGLSSGFHIIDPEVRADFSQYVKNCVVGDILINHKYSMRDLVNSTDIWSTISANPSPIRGMFFKGGEFKTCAEATPILKSEIDNDTKNNAWKFFGIRIFSGKDETVSANKLQETLESASKYYTGTSKGATAIMQQNIMINAIRNGVLDYATEAEATAAMLNISTTETMEKMRMTWATSLNTITYVLPIMQTDLLLLLLCMFPLVILITVQPGFGYKVFKSYFYSLLWIESWPMLFSFLNLAVTFYLQTKTQGLAVAGFTLSNSDQLALEHSDVANMAGYLMTCVPFIAIGIVKGMDSAFSSAAQYIGGTIHSTASGVASEVATGNMSLGNVSYNNVNANKFDTNATHMEGMSTEQLANGGTVMHTASGADVWNASPAISHLATSVKAGEMLSASYSKQAESSEAAAMQQHAGYEHSVSSAANHFEQLAKSSSLQKGYGENHATGNTSSIDQHASEMYSVVESVAKRNGVSWNEAFKGMTSLSQGINGHVGFSNNIIGAKANVDASHQRSNEQTTSNSVDVNINASNEELNKFSKDWNAIQNFSSSQHADTGHSLNTTELTQLSHDLRDAKSHAAGYSNSLTESERLSKLANITLQRSSQIDEDANQGFAEYVQKTVPKQEATQILGNTNDQQIAAQREEFARQYVNSPQIRGKIENIYQGNSEGIRPSERYQSEVLVAATKQNGKLLQEDYNSHVEHIKQKAHDKGVDFDDTKINEIKDKVSTGNHNTAQEINNYSAKTKDLYKPTKEEAHKDIKEGAERADLSPIGDLKASIAGLNVLKVIEGEGNSTSLKEGNLHKGDLFNKDTLSKDGFDQLTGSKTDAISYLKEKRHIKPEFIEKEEK